MARDTRTILETAQTAFESQARELEATRNRQLRAVVTKTASGSGDIAQTFSLNRKYRLVFVRCHFSGGAGTAAFTLSVDSGAGVSFDTQLFTVTQAGTNKDVHLRIDGGAVLDPSPWTFQASDSVRIDWTNPAGGTMNWGLEVGLALAS